LIFDFKTTNLQLNWYLSFWWFLHQNINWESPFN